MHSSEGRTASCGGPWVWKEIPCHTGQHITLEKEGRTAISSWGLRLKTTAGGNAQAHWTKLPHTRRWGNGVRLNLIWEVLFLKPGWRTLDLNVYDGPMGIPSVFHLSVYLSCSKHMHTHVGAQGKGRQEARRSHTRNTRGRSPVPILHHRAASSPQKDRQRNLQGFAITVLSQLLYLAQRSSKSAKGSM